MHDFIPCKDNATASCPQPTTKEIAKKVSYRCEFIILINIVQKWCGVEQSRQQGVVARGQQRQGNARSWATRPRSVVSAYHHERRSSAGMCMHEKRELPLCRGQQCSRRGSIEEHAIPRQLPAPLPPHTVVAAPSTPSRPRELRACPASGDKMRAYCWACPPLRPSLSTKSRGGFAGSRTADSRPRCAHWA